VVGEVAVDLAEQRDHLAAQGFDQLRCNHAGGAVAANMRTTVKRHARAAAGADNDRKHGLSARRGAIHRFRYRQAVGIVRQPNFAIQPLAQVFIERLAVEPGGVGIFHYAGIRRNRTGDPHPNAAALSGRLLCHIDQGGNILYRLPIIVPRSRQTVAKQLLSLITQGNDFRFRAA